MIIIIILKDVKILVLKRVVGPVTQSTYISTILKNIRMMRNLTLHEATKNICSEAFLSKVERNLMDPRNERVELLCERYNLNYNDLINLDDNKKIELLLLYFFKQDFDSILAMSSCTCEGEYIAQDEIVKCFQQYIKKDYKNLQATVLKLDTIKQCLSDLELFALILIVYEYNFMNLQLNKAKEYLDVLKLFNNLNDQCNDYIKEREFILLSKMKSNETKYAFSQIRDKMLYYNYEKSTIFSLIYFDYLDSKKVIEFCSNINFNAFTQEKTINEIVYMKAKALIALNEFDQAFDVIRSYDKKDFRFVTLFAYCIVKKMNYKMKSKEIVNKLYIDTDEFKLLKNELVSYIKTIKQEQCDLFNVAFLRLMQYEIDRCEEEVIANYIKNYLLKELEELSFPLYDKYIKNRYCELLGKLCRYKDAYQFLLTINNNND